MCMTTKMLQYEINPENNATDLKNKPQISSTITQIQIIENNQHKKNKKQPIATSCQTTAFQCTVFYNNSEVGIATETLSILSLIIFDIKRKPFDEIVDNFDIQQLVVYFLSNIYHIDQSIFVAFFLFLVQFYLHLIVNDFY